MKSFYLILFFILASFVIISKASTELQISDEMPIQGGGYKIWVDEVTGFNKDDPNNGYAGVLGKPITSLRVSGDKQYRIHRKAVADWLSPVTGNDQFDYTNGYAGSLNGENIDGIIITGNVSYAVHVIGEGWLPAVKGDNINDFDNYAGIFGKSIDAIMIENRRYATSYYSKDKISNKISNNISVNTSNDDSCTAKGGTCMNPSNCSGTVASGLCQGDTNKCCIPNASDLNNSGSINPLYIIVIILLVILFILIILSIYFVLSKKWIKRSITSTLNNLPSQNNNNDNGNSNNNNNNDNNNNNEDEPPSYFDVVNETSQGSIIIYSSSSSSIIKKNSGSHSQIKVIPNNNNLKNNLFAIMEGSSSSCEKKGSIPTVDRSKAVMINLDEPLENSSSENKETVPTVERSKAVMINLEEPLERYPDEKK